MKIIISILLVFIFVMADSDKNITAEKYEPLVRPYLNQGTKALEKKYSWLYEKMDDILMSCM